MENAELQKRITTGAAMAAVFVMLDLLAKFSDIGKLCLALIGVVLVGMCAVEFTQFSTTSKVSRVFRFLVVMSPMVALPLAPYYGFDRYSEISFSCGVALGVFVLLIAMFSAGRNSIEKAGIVFAELAPAQLIIGIGGLSLCSITLLKSGAMYLLWLVALVSINDTAAYFGGRALKGPKLAPALSPGKTISGGIVGFLSTLILGSILGFIFNFPGSIWLSILISMLIGIASQLGDLTKSYLKRVYQVKDSGSILPGHGGMLDRLDGMLGASILLLPILIIINS